MFGFVALGAFAGVVVFGALFIITVIRRDPKIIAAAVMFVCFAALIGASVMLVVSDMLGEPDASDEPPKSAESLGPDGTVLPEESAEPVEGDAAPSEGAEGYAVGETWTVDGQWKLTITGVAETQYRNEFSDKKPGAVYIVDYTYTNLGFEDELSDGLLVSIGNVVVDSGGKVCGEYPGDISSYAKETPIGATCDAQECIWVETPGSFRLTVTKYDGNKIRQSAVFSVEVE
ncbi:MAG: hypothetical protein K1W21_00675 [Oscillospiraceae bacterium]